MKTRTLTFDNYQEFMHHVRTLPVSRRAQNEMLEHEKAHLETAARLGYGGEYQLDEITLANGHREYQPAFMLYGEVENPEHIRAIIMAPKHPSESDLAKLKECVRED